MSSSPIAIGIDLGTTYSAVCHIDATGRPVTLVNREGDLLTPSIVLVEGDSVVVGREALKAISLEPDRVADCVKRSVGHARFDRKVDGRDFPPEVLQACILRRLVLDASRLLGPVQYAVITVPAYFDETRRKSTQDAGYIAGLQVLDIINEPTAAAITFGFQKGLVAAPDPNAAASDEASSDASSSDASGDTHAAGASLNAPGQTVLVYDLGGGTFDVTIMRIAGRDFTTLATDGDVELGGRDFDNRLVDEVARRFQAEHDLDPRQEPGSLGRLWRECEDAKRTLSARAEATIVCEFLGLATKVRVTRELFQELTADLLDRTRFTVRQVMQSAGLEGGQIDRVLMVGGSTRMPAVAEMLAECFGKPPESCLAADEAVAQGAALRARQVLDRTAGKPRTFTIRNVNSHSLGVVATERGTGRKRSAIIIPRNTPLPAQARRIFKTQTADQRSVLAPIVEGESPAAEHCTPIGSCEIRNLPENLPAGSPVAVTFRYAANGRLAVTVQVPGADKPATQEIDRPHGLTPDELDQWRGWVERSVTS